MYYAYILRSEKSPDETYIGSTSDLRKRLTEHNSGQSIHTNKFKPWKVLNLRCLRVFFGLLLAGAFAIPTVAHHAFTAEFDAEQGLTITGAIVGVDWINPHVQLYVDAKDDDGNVIHWTLEGPPTAHWHVAGLKKDMLPNGQVVKLLCYRAKDGTKNLAWLRKITFIGGPHDAESHEMWFGGLDKNGNPTDQ